MTSFGETLVQNPPEAVLAWRASGGYAEITGFNWLGLIEVAGDRISTLKPAPLATRIGWGLVTLEALERAELLDAIPHRDALVRRLYVAAKLTHLIGSADGPIPYGADDAAREFLAAIPFEPAELEHLLEIELLQHAKQGGRYVDILRALRTVKVWLGPMKLVAPHIADDSLRARVETWLALRDRLS